MSDEEQQNNEEEQVLTAEYKDGQLQIVEVTPFDKNDGQNVTDTTGKQTKYLEVMDNKALMQFDLLNFTLVKCEDSDNSYRMVGPSSDDGDTTLTCVLSTEDSEGDNENQDTYVVMNSAEGHDPLVFLQSSLQQIHQQQSLRNKDANIKPLTSAELLEKAKELQKAKALLQLEGMSRPYRGRKRKNPGLPPPMEMLTSPNFKLYLYSCKMCNFKCNSIKEMSSHKATEHIASRTKSGNPGRSGGNLQCARCPYRGTVHAQLMKHVEAEHLSEKHVVSEETTTDGDVSEADVLVCGACGFESSDGNAFQEHVQKDHGVSVMLKGNLLSVEDDSSQSD